MNYSRVEGTKAFANFSVGEIFDLAKAHVRISKVHPYLTDITTAKLRWHLPSMNSIGNQYFQNSKKNWENKRTEEIGLVTPTPKVPRDFVRFRRHSKKANTYFGNRMIG